MKVLMYGWEFPPHISGGLGTACFGLTESLIKAEVKVLFVVPRLFDGGNEKVNFLIDASTITSQTRKKNPGSSDRQSPTIFKAGAIQKESRVKKQAGVTYIEVLANLFPYRNMKADAIPQLNRYTAHVSLWNYSLSGLREATREIESEHFNEDFDGPYLFSGAYGSNLMEEVKRYAVVAGKIAKRHSFDVIHVHDWMTFPAGVAAKHVSKKPLVVHVHSTELDRSGEHINQDVFEIEKSGLKEADKIITVSNWTKRIVMSQYGIPEEKISVIHNGISPKPYDEGFNFPEIGSHFVTFLGRVTHQKGPGFFVEAARKVLEEYPEAHFIVAGAGDLLPQIIERVAQLNMSSNFHFTGFLKGRQVNNIWSLTDVYVMPSVSEPFGIASLEAIQGGVPVILSNQSGVSEVMPHAIKVDFWNIKALASAICNVLRYESLSNVLRQNSQQHIQHLTWDKAASNINALYHDLIRKRKR